MQPGDEFLRLCAKFIGCAVVMNDVVRTLGLFLDWHLCRKTGFGLRKRHPPRRCHPLDLPLACGSDTTYYIKIFLPVCFKQKRNYSDTNRTDETTETNGTGDSPVCHVCPGGPVSPARPVKPSVDFLFDDWVNLRLECAALLWVGKHFGGDAATLLGVREKFVNDIVGVKRLDAEFVQKLRKEGFAAGNPSR